MSNTELGSLSYFFNSLNPIQKESFMNKFWQGINNIQRHFESNDYGSVSDYHQAILDFIETLLEEFELEISLELLHYGEGSLKIKNKTIVFHTAEISDQLQEVSDQLNSLSIPFEIVEI